MNTHVNYYLGVQQMTRCLEGCVKSGQLLYSTFRDKEKERTNRREGEEGGLRKKWGEHKDKMTIWCSTTKYGNLRAYHSVTTMQTPPIGQILAKYLPCKL